MYGINGRVQTFAAYRGKPLVINVWASWCGPCRAEMGSLERLSRLDQKKQFRVIGISTDDDAAKAHDIGPDAKRAHGGEGHQEAHRQHDDGDQRRADMQQEDKCDQRHDDAFLKKRRP